VSSGRAVNGMTERRALGVKMDQIHFSLGKCIRPNFQKVVTIGKSIRTKAT
jgi:hypothetical protein